MRSTRRTSAKPDNELATARERALVLETRNAQLEQTIDWMRAQMERALENERYAMRTMANLAMQQRYGVKPYPDAAGMTESVAEPALPEGFTPTRQGVDMVNEARARLLDEYRQAYPKGDGPIPLQQLEELRWSI